MATLPDNQPTRDAIYDAYVRKHADDKSRPYLGLSRIGGECRRKLWLEFRWCGVEIFQGRIQRLFETGHREEERIIANLREAGLTVDGQQFAVVAVSGHASGHFDGVCQGVKEAPKTWHLLECKTHNDRSFKALKKDGVAKAKPEHYAQMQAYMGLGDLTRALYVAANKNDDEIYTERVEFSKDDFDALMSLAEKLIKSPVPFEKIADKAEAYPCKVCHFAEQCHAGKVADVNCRTCAHATPVTDFEGGVWVCEKTQARLSEEEQRAGCTNHLLIPELIPYAEAINGGDGFIEYKHRTTGEVFANVEGACFPLPDMPCHSSKELQAMPGAAAGNVAVANARDALGGRIVK